MSYNGIVLQRLIGMLLGDNSHTIELVRFYLMGGLITYLRVFFSHQNSDFFFFFLGIPVGSEFVRECEFFGEKKCVS